MKNKEEKHCYVDNKHLRELVVEFNNTNIDDYGDWCGSYLVRLDNKWKKAQEQEKTEEVIKEVSDESILEIEVEQDEEPKETKPGKRKKKPMTLEQYEGTKDFIKNKMKQIEELHAYYDGLSSEEKQEFNRKLTKVRDELGLCIIKIIDGRINSFGLRSNPKYTEHLSDIANEAYISVRKYINRYNDARATSAFAYITELATNGILYALKEINEREEKFITGLDFFENINTIDDPKGKNPTLDNFID